MIDDSLITTTYNQLMSSLPAKVFPFAWHCSRENFFWGLAAVTAVCCATATGMVGHYIVKQVVDAASLVDTQNPHTVADLWFWGCMYPLNYLMSGLTWRLSGFAGMRWITRTSAAVYEALFAYLSQHSASYFADRFAGALSNKISNAATGIASLQQQCLWQFLGLALSILGSLILCWSAHPWLALVFILWVFLFVGSTLLFMTNLRSKSYTYAESASTLKGKLVDSTTNIEAVQQAAQTRYEQKYVGGFIAAMRSAHLASWSTFEWVLVFNSLMLAVFNLAMLALGIYLYLGDAVTLGSLTMLISLIAQLRQQIFFLGHAINEAIRNYGQVQEGLDELLLPHAIRDTLNAKPLVASAGAIKFKDVDFAYGSQQVFRNFSLSVAAGEKVGIVGASGVGKSTLVGLLLRQYEPTGGSIRIDDTNISGVTLDSLRRVIAVVPQSTPLFHRSIYDNIRYGRHGASQEEVRAAAEKAQAHEFILACPKGYDTFVGERGVKLSGGQRQRISIARAILKDAPILVLDEATSALDSESEKAIQEALEQLMGQKTVLAIAHRLSTLRAMDRIIVLADEGIIEDGSHAELLEQNGVYARLWQQQVDGFTPEIFRAN